MKVSVPGFGGAEIGLEGAEESTVARLLGAALDAGLNMIDTAWIASRPWFQLAAVSGGDRRA
jgi:aryl-alcohol dehydrogenase-like predicted oxidoreductase